MILQLPIKKKFCHHHPDDPIFQMANQALPLTQLKCSNWQYKLDQILETTGFYSARLDVHQPCPLDLRSLGYQKSIHFVPTIPPWNIAGSSHIHIIPTIPGVHKSDLTEL
jgi:hypothetical protein